MKIGEQKKHRSSNIDWSKIRILAVDDDKFILLDFKGIIERFGGYCDIAENGEQALALLNQNQNYNMFFLDWRMPGMNGIELTEKLRAAMSDQSNSVIVMISAAESSAISARARTAGVNKLMMKPLFPSTIEEIIGEYFGAEESAPKEDEDENIVNIFAGRRILLAEDVEINREIVLALLEPTGITVDCAVNGLEAVRIFCESPGAYDMIFMDMQMPEMDGLEATRRIRASDVVNAKQIPIIAMTANVFKVDIENCLAAGMNAHIGKPINFREVIDRLKACLG